MRWEVGPVLAALLPASAALGGSASGAAAQTAPVADVAYVAGAEANQHLDLYLPPERGFATFVYVHGGSLTSGDRKDVPAPELCRRSNAEGFACASVGYRLFPGVDWPEPARDVAASVAWLHGRIAEHGGRPDAIFLLGHSSGCLLATHVAANERLLGEHGLTPRDLAGVVALGCRLNHQPPDTAGIDPERIARYFREDPTGSRFGSYQARLDYVPFNHVGAHMPPILVLMADGERFKPPILEDAAVFVGLARDCEVDAEIEILEDRTHMSALTRMPEPGDPGFDVVLGFARRLIAEGPRSHLADRSRCPR